MKAFSGIKKVVYLFIIFGTIQVSVAQEETRSQFWSQVRFGGGIGLSFGD